MSFDERDKEILQHLAEGLTNKELTEKVFRSEGAIKQRLHKLRRKYNCKNTAQLIAKFINLNML